MSAQGGRREASRSRGASLHGLAVEEPTEVVGEFTRGLVAVLRIVRRRLHDDPVEIPRHVAEEPARRRETASNHRLDDHLARLLLVRGLADEQLVQDHPDAVDVGARVGGLASDALRRHVARRPHEVPGGSERGEIVGGHEAEVEEDRRPVAPQHHVLRLQVAMQDPLIVGGLHGVRERARDLGGASPGFGSRDRRERLALDEVHHDVGRAVLDARLVDGDDVLVLEPREGLHLATEALHRSRPGERCERKQLDGVRSPAVLPLVHDAHASASDLAKDAVGTDKLLLGRRGIAHRVERPECRADRFEQSWVRRLVVRCERFGRE